MSNGCPHSSTPVGSSSSKRRRVDKPSNGAFANLNLKSNFTHPNGFSVLPSINDTNSRASTPDSGTTDEEAIEGLIRVLALLDVPTFRSKKTVLNVAVLDFLSSLGGSTTGVIAADVKYDHWSVVLSYGKIQQTIREQGTTHDLTLQVIAVVADGTAVDKGTTNERR